MTTLSRRETNGYLSPSPVLSTPGSTPFHSRSTSPLPGAFYSSDSDSETSSYPLSPRLSWKLRPRRRRRRHGWRCFRRLRTRFLSLQLFLLVLFSLFAVALTLLIMYILNPDKDPLPWRAYCAPNQSNAPLVAPFPPPNFDTLPPAGLFVGVFSTDSSFERRQLVRTTWAGHPRSRNGAGQGDNGLGTSRTIVRFILGLPRKNWERRVKLEMETYKDMVIMPIPENMNAGKTHTFFSWAAINAFVPPVQPSPPSPPPSSSSPPFQFSYINSTSPPPDLAPHDPHLAVLDALSEKPNPWVRPDFVLKVDDDAFLMLAELEARLRVELHQWPKNNNNDKPPTTSTTNSRADSLITDRTPAIPKSSSSLWSSAHWNYDPYVEALRSKIPRLDFDDPLIYWGYLVTNRLHTFMAGEIYGLSWGLIEWVSRDDTVRTMRRGKEDKQTSKWIRLHPRASEVRWVSERCWVYDHPRSGTVYSHGFLFPSEVTRIREQMVADIQPSASSAWAYSSVSTFGTRYHPPPPDLTMAQSVEALVEGSDMSKLREGSPMSSEYAWRNREGRLARYEGKRVGGTVAVHFIKKNMWYLETALALLEGDEYSEAEKYELNRFLERERDMHDRRKPADMKPIARGREDKTAAMMMMKTKDGEAPYKRKARDEKLQREF